MKNKKYFLSFTEEFWQGQKVRTMGRVEVYTKDEQYAIEEIRWGTDMINEFLKFRDKWDFKNVDQKILDKIRKTLDEKFCIKRGDLT